MDGAEEADYGVVEFYTATEVLTGALAPIGQRVSDALRTLIQQRSAFDAVGALVASTPL